MADLKEKSLSLLSSTTVSFAADAVTTLFTVPNGKRCVISHAVVVAGADAGATTTVSIGQVGALTDFVPDQTLSSVDAQYDVALLRPIQAATPAIGKSYAAGTIIQADVGTQSGGATNTIDLFGYLY